MLQKYAEQKENLTDDKDININHNKLFGEMVTRSFRTYENVLNEFAEFCKDRREHQKDLFALALVEFLERYQ